MDSLFIKKSYYYIICLVLVYTLLWGAVGLLNSFGLFFFSPADPYTYSVTTPPSIVDTPEDHELNAAPTNAIPVEDLYLQKRILYENIINNIIKILVAGALFIFLRTRLNKLKA
ncbi:MAG: hypothetical protein ABIA63_12645 [bacterium]